MSSGIAVTEECKEAFNAIKIGHKHSYIVYKISDDCKHIEVESYGKIGETFEDFQAKLIEAERKEEGRYAVYDFVSEEQSNKGRVEGLLFIVWVSDNIKTKQKMLYASSKDALKKVIVGVKKEIQVNDAGDLNIDSFKEQIMK